MAAGCGRTWLYGDLLVSAGCNCFLKLTGSPGRRELHVGVEESRHLSGRNLPALDSGSDQSLPLLVPDDLHQAGVALVHVLLQWPLQLLCGVRIHLNQMIHVHNGSRFKVFRHSRRSQVIFFFKLLISSFFFSSATFNHGLQN